MLCLIHRDLALVSLSGISLIFPRRGRTSNTHTGPSGITVCLLRPNASLSSSNMLITNCLVGDIVSFHVPGFHTVIINSAKVAKDLFEKRSAIYSDRPSMEMTNLWVFHRYEASSPYQPDDVGYFLLGWGSNFRQA